MNNNYENKILDAIQTLVDNAVTKAGYDKTIKAVVSKCVNESTGKYVVRYQDSSFYAYSNDLDSIYSGGTPVYVLVPGNDMSQTKTILGSVDKLGTEYITLSESNAAYQEVGTSVVTPNGAIPGISSYKAGGDSLVIYDRTSSNNLVNVDLEGIELYFQQSNYMEIGGTFITRLPEEQKRKGNYGLVFDMDFYNGEEIVNKQYVLDINSMTGNPYSYNLGSEQNAIFEIDGANFYRLNSITLECKNFPKSATPYTNDIFVEDIILKALTPLTRDELANNSLTFTTKQGIYFNENDSASATRLIETEIKINKKVVPNTGGLLRFYWFKEDSTIGITSADYLPFGGPGWKCLNEYNVIDETNNIRDYITDADTLTVVKSENPARENEYKCVVIYNNEVQVERNIIIYNTASEYTITIESDQGNYFKYNEGNPTLTCSVNPAGTYTYIWTETNSANRTEVLSETSNSYSVQLGSIANFSKFTCSVFSNGNFLGKSNIVITNSWDPEDNSYAIVMENGDQIFKYNEKGIAPTNKSLEKPIILKPLQFTIYDEFGHEVDDNKISATDVSWYVPKEDTMIKVTTTGITPVEEDGYLIYSGVKTLNFEIASVYNNKKMNNAIKLNVRYNDRVLNTTSELEFIKEGEIGSNGTDFVCRIVPNVAANAQVPNYPIYTYNTTTSIGAMNYTLAANNKWFKVQLYKDGVQIYEGVASGTSEESKTVTVAWSMLTNKYSNTVSDTTSFNVNSSTGEFSYTNLSDTNLDRAANITKVTVTYDGATYYATMPIILVRVSNASYKLDLENNTGFRYVMYTTDGLNPVYDSSNPFALIAYNGTTDITNNNNITFTYSTLGQTYNGTTWVNENNFIVKTHGASNPLAKNEADYRPIEKFDGLSVNNAVKCIVKESGSEKARIYLPIHFYLNRFGNAALNGWDGNHVEINSNGGFILAPQIGAGKKEQDNSYTGVFMGSVREAGSSDEEVGLFGYNSGVRTLELNAEDGSAKFGKQGAGRIIIDPGTGDYDGKGTARLYSDDYSITYTKPSEMVPAQTKYTAGFSYWRKVNNTEYRLLREGTDYAIGSTIAVTDYVWSNGSGLEIDLNDPHIRFGSGKFRVDSDGQVYATGFVTVNNLEAGDYNIPSGSIDVGSGDTLNDYIYNTDVTLNNLQSQIDGAIQFWNGEAIPTLNNYPANEWTTEEERTNHQADIYTVIYDEDGEWKQGKSYRFDKVNGTWMWIELTDNEMSAVQALAASKAKVFVATPYVPYSIGDLWLKDGKDLYKCKTAKDSGGSYSASDWELATDYTNDDRADAAYSKAEDAETAIQTTVRQVDVEYGVSTSSTTAPTSWSTASPTWEEDKFVWSRQKVTYVNGTTVTRNEVCIQGAKGEDGTSGEPGTNGANTATIYLYKRSASAPTSSMPYSSNVTYTFANQNLNPAPSNSWTTSIPTGTNPLYVTIAVAYSNTATDTIAANEWSTPVKFVENGAKGQDGRGIASTEVRYVADTQGTTPPADSASWSTNPPSGDNKGKFIWTRTKITYTDSQNPTTSYSVSYEGTNGINGDSITITSQAIEYAVGENGTSHPTSGWSTTIPSVPDTKYLWTRTTVNYSDNTTTVSYSASYQSKDGENGTSATNVVCGNEAQIISCDKDGKVAAQTDITIPFAGYLGNTRKACSVTPTGLPDGMTIQSNTAATTSADGSLVLRVAANSTLGGATAGTVTLTFGCNSLSFVKKFAWSKAIKGADGENGKSIVVDTTTITYQNSTSGTTKPTGTWTSSPSPEEGKYTWTKTVTTYKLSGTSTSAGSSTSYSVAYTGPKGDQGRSLVKQTPLHYLKSNDIAPAAPTSHVTSTSTAAGVWTTAMPEYVDGYTYFACSENEFNEAPLYEWTNVVKDNGLNDALTIANQAKESVDELVDAIDNPTNTILGQKYFDITDAAEKPLIDFKMYGDTQQDSTPTPSSPQPIHNVSGDNTIEICGKNLFNAQIMAGTYGNAVYTIGSDGLITQSDTDNSAWNINQNRVFYLSAGTYTIRIWGTRRYLQVRNLTDNSDLLVTPNDSATFTLNDRKAVAIKTYGTASGLTYPVSYYIQIEKGSTATSYEPYTGQSQLISLGDIELNKINTYQDYIYKTDKWHLHKEIGKVVLDGTETRWSMYGSSGQRKWYLAKAYFGDNIPFTNDIDKSNRFRVSKYISGNWINNSFGWHTSANSMIFDTDFGESVSDWTTWLSTHNTIVYYVLNTPQEIEITDTTLLEQLNNLMTIPLYKNMTHITLTANDLNPDMDIEYIKDNVINNNFVTAAEMNQTKEDVSNIQEIADAAYDQAQSVVITYTTTDTSDTPDDSANWVNILPSAPDKYIWQKTLYTYLDDSRNNSVVTCIYTPTRITNELEYCLCSDRNYSDANRTNPWRSEPYPWDDSYFAASGIGDITILRYQFVRNRYTDINKITDADSYSTPILDQSWYMFGLKIASEKVAREALENNINNNIIKMDAQTGLTVSSADNLNGIRLTNWGIQFLSGNDWVTVWDIKGNLDASLINVTHLKAEDILSGTLTLDPTINDGKFYLSGSQGSNTIIDGDGVKVTDVTGNTVHLQATSSGGVSAKTSANEEYFKIHPGTKETTMTNGQVDNNLGLGDNIKIVQTTHGIAFIGIYESSS